MLVEYNFETKDEDMQPRAIELRKRVAARKLAAAVSSGRVGERSLKRMGELNKRELEEHAHENYSVSMAGVNAKVAVARAEQQLNVEDAMRRLDVDLNRITKLGKSRMDTLNDLERRIVRMRQELQAPKKTTVEEELGRDLRVNYQMQTDKQFEVCTRCQRRILKQLFEAHDHACGLNAGRIPGKRAHESKDGIYDVNVDLTTALTTFTPQPPFDFRVVDKGTTFIQWEWEEPITDGGLPVYEYELSFIAKRMDWQPRKKRYKTTAIQVDSYLTTLICSQDPVCHAGARVVGLLGSTEHINWRMRCRNLQGWSDWVDMMDKGPEGDQPISVFTQDVEAPSPPLFFRFIRNTSSCIYLAWDPPFYDGGREIVGYVISYTVNEIHTTLTERDIIIPVDMQYHAGGSVLAAVLRNLPAKTKVVNITIKAVNFGGMTSDATKLEFLENVPEAIETDQCSRHAFVARELARSANAKGDFIDSDFYTGVMQRLRRIDHISALEQEMKIVKPDELEMQEARELQAIQEYERLQKDAKALEDGGGEDNEDWGDEDETMMQMEKTTFTNRQRRQHFKVRIESLGKKLVSLKAERFNIDTERSRLTQLMKTRQAHQVALQMERDRCKDFKGSVVTSAILMGAPNQYVLGDFLKKLERAIDECKAEISESKLLVMKGELRKAKVKTSFEQAEVELKNRKALFLQFEHDHQKRIKMLHRMTDGADEERIKIKYFAFLVENRDQRIRARYLITHIFTRRVYWQVRNAFTRWSKGEVVDSVEHHVDPHAPISLGGTMLETARQKRVELQGLLRQAMASTVDIQQKFKLAAMDIGNRRRLTRNKDFRGTTEGMDHMDAEANGMHYLYEADGYALEGNFTLAHSTYDNQIIYLRSKPKLNIKLLAITHGHYGKMCLREGKFDRAIVEFGRQLSLAREIDDRPEMADAYFGMGSGYLQIRQYDDAIRYLDIAQTRLSSLGNMPAYCGAMRDLREVYLRVGKMDIVAMYDDKIDRVEGEMRVKIGAGATRLKELQSRLNNSNADIEQAVHIERMTLRAIQTRMKIDELSNHLDELAEDEDKQQEVVTEITTVLGEIEEELSFAWETDDSEMMTHLVHDQPQMMNVEEVKQRLKVRKLKDMERLKEQQNELQKVTVKVKNAEDEIHELNQILDLENGALMKNTRTDLAFRCVGMCGGNVSGNEITGTSSGGSEIFLAAESNNIHAIDYHSGAITHVMAGEPKGTHRPGVENPKTGHESTVTCIFHDCQTFFSGSTDETIIRWDLATHKFKTIYEGHEGSIVCIVVDGPIMASSSSDATVRLWDKESAHQLRVLYGHQKSVLAMDLGPSWLLTGSSDEDVRVWTLAPKGKHSLKVDCRYRLQGHECHITCVKYGKLEVVSGDNKGRIFVWWMKTGEVLKVIQAHSMAIRCLQFDAVSIVTGSVDSDVCIIDIATGEVLQKLRGHTAAVLGVAFDTERIVSIGGDNTIRYWTWGKKKVGGDDKYHVLDTGQSLLQITKLYPGLTVQELMSWNGISDPKQMYAGMKLIVKKGDPTQPTEAEKSAQLRLMRKEQGMALQTKRFKTGAGTVGGVRRYDRVYRMAMDVDFHSLGNRMNKKSKEDHELFPDTVNLDANPYALSKRLAAESHPEAGGAKKSSALNARFFFSQENVHEWGEIADQLAEAMLCLLTEYESYEIVLENKRMLRSTTSLIGRINAYEKHIEDAGSRAQAMAAKYHVKAKRFLMPEERKELRHKERRERKEKRRQERLAANRPGTPDSLGSDEAAELDAELDAIEEAELAAFDAEQEAQEDEEEEEEQEQERELASGGGGGGGGGGGSGCGSGSRPTSRAGIKLPPL